MKIELLYKFFNGGATPEETESIRAWKESDPEHERVFFREWKLYNAMVMFDQKRLNSIKSNRSMGRKIAVFTLRTAAVIALAIIGSWFINNLTDEDMSVSPVMQSVYVPAGQRANVILPDGSSVWVNALSTIRYSTAFNGDNRTVELDGEAYFDVVKNQNLPFIVRTKRFNAEVLGTSFNIEAYGNREVFETTLMEGSVKLSLSDNTQQSVILSPGYTASLVDGKFNVRDVENYDRYRWREGLICFRNESFVDIMQKFEKYHDITIVLDTNKFVKSYYTGKFRQSDGVEYALKVLQRDIKFMYTRDNDKNVIYIK